MKKIIAALSILALAACQQEPIQTHSENGLDIFKAETESFRNETRTSLDQTNTVIWAADDNVAVFNGSTLADAYQVTDESVGSDKASFRKIQQSYSTDDFFSGTELPVNIAVYPYSSDLVCNNASDAEYCISNVTIPEIQTYQKNAFPDEAFIMAAITEDVADRYLNFKNVCGVFNLKLTGTGTVSSIELSGHSGELLSGNGTIHISNDGSAPALTLSEDASQKVTLDCKEGVVLDESVPTSFMIVTAPVRFEKGFNLRITKSNGDVVVMSSEKANEIKRSRILEMPALRFQDYTDISIKETANSYIISQSGCYRFKAVKGNGSESVGTAASAEVLWETFGTETAPQVGDLISEAGISDGYITFKTNREYKEGNAVIAAKDASGKILWSWHIWFTDAPASQVYKNDAGIMMDRNLGATSAEINDPASMGLLYQWGRKDPFLNICAFETYDTNPDDGERVTLGVRESKSTITWPSPVDGNKNYGTIAYAIANPTTFITYERNLDWLYSSTSTTDATRWQSVKTIYDPCPAGWRVPDGGPDGIWVKHGLLTDGEVHHSTYPGLVLKGAEGEDMWYPMSTCIRGSTGVYETSGIAGSFWSATQRPNTTYFYTLEVCSYSPKNGLGRGSDIVTFPSYSSYAGYGNSVRCCRITE
jgi:hypothetical protein